MAKTQKILDTRTKLLGAAVVSLILSYLLGSRALDTGSYWQYLACLILFIWTIKLLVRAIKYGKN